MVRRIEQQVTKRVNIAALLLAHPDYNSEALLTFPDLRRRPPPERRFDHILDVGDVQSVARRALPVDFDLQLRNTAGAIDKGAADTADRGDQLKHFLDLRLQEVGVIAEHLDDDLSVDLRDRFEYVVADRLRKARLDARHLVEHLLHLGDQILFGDILAAIAHPASNRPGLPPC